MASRPYPAGEFIRNIFSVIVGVLVFFGLLFAVLPLFNDVYERMYKSDSVNSAQMVSGIYLALFFAIVLVSGLLTGLIATRRKVLHAFITGCVLVVLYVLAVGKNVNWEAVKTSTEALLVNMAVPVILLLASLVGGWLSLVFRKKRI